MQELTGKVAVVTGAGSGIGRALALRFAAEGMRLAVADIEEAALVETVALLAAEHPATEVLHRVVDVTDGDAVLAFADAVYERWDATDVLCNNAGVFVGGVLWERPVADLEFVLGVNLWGVLHGIRAFVPRMVAAGTEGHVVNTASVAGLFGAPFGGPYGISKFAAFAASESLAQDLAASGSKVRASALCPGIVKTNIVGSDRNRPDALATELTEDQRFVTGYLGDAVEIGIEPSVVAGLVVDGIRAETFLILTHDVYADRLSTRAGELVDRALPAYGDFA